MSYIYAPFLLLSEDSNDLLEAARRVQRERTEKKRTEKRTETLNVRTETATVRKVITPPTLARERTEPIKHNKPSFPPTPAASVPGSAMSSKSVRTKELLVKIKSDVSIW